MSDILTSFSPTQAGFLIGAAWLFREVIALLVKLFTPVIEKMNTKNGNGNGTNGFVFQNIANTLSQINETLHRILSHTKQNGNEIKALNEKIKLIGAQLRGGE